MLSMLNNKNKYRKIKKIVHQVSKGAMMVKEESLQDQQLEALLMNILQLL
jgi:hypothetical protein